LDKFIMNKLFLNRAACIAGIASLALLTACGGGGSGTGTEKEAFLFKTSELTDPVLKLTRTDKAFIGTNVQVIISEGSCADTGPGIPLNPIIVNEISRFGYIIGALPASTASTAPLTLTGLQLPTSMEEVLVTVVDGNSILYNRIHPVNGLNGLNVQYFVPATGEAVEPNAAQFDLCPQPNA
jgi:hypothetical protein